MRFRTKFAWVQFAGAILWIGLSYSWSHNTHATSGIRSSYLVGGIFWLFLALSCIVNYFFTWWDVDDSGLTQRRLWKTRTIPWNEITHIGPWQPNSKPIPQWLAQSNTPAPHPSPTAANSSSSPPTATPSPEPSAPTPPSRLRSSPPGNIEALPPFRRRHRLPPVLLGTFSPHPAYYNYTQKPPPRRIGTRAVFDNPART